MSDDNNWLKNPTLPRPPAVPRFELAELEGMPDRDRRFIARSYAREARRQRSSRVSGVASVNNHTPDEAADATSALPERRIA